MTRTLCTTLTRGTLLAIAALALGLSYAPDADAHGRRVRRVVPRPARAVVVVRPAPVVVAPAPVVVVRPAPLAVRYVPARHRHCVRRSGYYYTSAFGYHRHTHDPRGIHFGVHVAF